MRPTTAGSRLAPVPGPAGSSAVPVLQTDAQEQKLAINRRRREHHLVVSKRNLNRINHFISVMHLQSLFSQATLVKNVMLVRCEVLNPSLLSEQSINIFTF